LLLRRSCDYESPMMAWLFLINKTRSVRVKHGGSALMAIVILPMHAVVRLSPFSVSHEVVSLSTVDFSECACALIANSVEEYRLGVAPRWATDSPGRDVSYSTSV
jgi:hypothetical protein